MTNEFTIDASEPVLVQFEVRGLQPVSRDDSQLIERSQKALASAMSTIQQMSERVVSTLKGINLADRPDEIEVEFGLVLTAEAGALIARVETEAGFKVKLKWTREKPKDDDSQAG